MVRALIVELILPFVFALRSGCKDVMMKTPVIVKNRFSTKIV